RPMTYKGAL
nr:Chain C, RL9 peptide [synthetic construct]